MTPPPDERPTDRRSRRILLGILSLGSAALVVALLLLREGNGEALPDRLEGDVEGAVAGIAWGDIPREAEALLASDRPWRAAQVMRSYLTTASIVVPAEHRILAARAEAGWGGWREARTLLEDVPELETHGHGIGLYVLARALDATGDANEAVAAYRTFLALPPTAELEDERDAARLRLGLALLRAGDGGAASTELEAASAELGGASLWLDLLRADALASAGDTAAVRQAVARFQDGLLGLRGWRARVHAARQAGDPPGARALANRARTWAKTDGTRAEFLVAAGKAAAEMGDGAAARDAFRSAIALDPGTAWAREAADLLRAGEPSPADHLAIARVARAMGLNVEAVSGLERWLAAGGGSRAERERVVLEHATALFYAERYDEVEAALAPISGSDDALLLRARADTRRNRPAEAVALYRTVADRRAGTAAGAEALQLAAGAWHDAGDVVQARELYQQVAARYPASTQAGLATMRLAGIAFVQKDYPAAAELWDRYRTRQPNGPLAVQATYWAGLARQERGDSAGAAGLFRAVRQRARDSYYAVLASERLGEPFWPLPMGAGPAPSDAASARVAGWMRGIDLLRTAGYPDEASADADRVVAAAGRDPATLYALAEAMVERGYSLRAIRLGLQLQAREPASRRLYRILYPFPFRALITEEARDRGLDPFVAAALIRQESMFEPRITSGAGARGLMQVMPATGQQLAEAAGVEHWTPDLLYHPEINVHLGTRYLAEDAKSYQGSLPSMFSAYNAGRHRVEWWSEFPEYGEDELFTERIPFRETRDYVKILTRNFALYRGLYGEGVAATAPGRTEAGSG